MDFDTEHKQRLIYALMRHRFQKEIDNMVAREIPLARRAYEEKFSEKERHLLESVPYGWVKKSDRIWIKANGGDYLLFYCGQFCVTPEPWAKESVDFKRVCEGLCDPFPDIFVLINDKALGDEIAGFAQERHDLKDCIYATQSSLTQQLKKIDSVNHLVELWPDIKPFIEALNITPASVPALPIADLNKMVGL